MTSQVKTMTRPCSLLPRVAIVLVPPDLAVAQCVQCAQCKRRWQCCALALSVTPVSNRLRGSSSKAAGAKAWSWSREYYYLRHCVCGAVLSCAVLCCNSPPAAFQIQDVGFNLCLQITLLTLSLSVSADTRSRRRPRPFLRECVYMPMSLSIPYFI